MATDKTASKLFAKRIFQLIVSVGGFAYIFYKVPFSSVVDNWSLSMTPWILLMLVAANLIMLIQANRWKGLSVQGPEIPFKTFLCNVKSMHKRLITKPAPRQAYNSNFIAFFEPFRFNHSQFPV